MIHKTDIFAAPVICGAAIALLLAAGCSKQETAVVTGFPEDGAVRIAANAGAPATRAGGSQYEGSTLGLFIDYGSGGYSEYNIMWSKDASGQWTPEKKMLWKDGKSGADIYAYAPFVGGSMSDVNPVAFEIPEDQSAGTMAADLVSWSRAGFVPDASKNNDFSDGKILISFSHRLVKMTFNFEKGNQFASDMTVVDATLFGTSSKVACDLKADNVTAASDAVSRDITLHKVENLKYEAVFFPGDGQKAGAKMLEVVMSDGTPLYYTVPATGLISGGLQPGKAYEMKMRLGKDKIELASDVAVADWTESGTTLPGGESILDADSWDGTVASGFAGGKGTSDDPYLISTSAQLAYLAQQVNGGTSYAGEYFLQTENFDLADKKWTPIGSSSSQAFRGHFDGGNKGVYCLNVDITGSYAGLFGYIRSGSVRNVGVFSGSVKSTGYNNVGGIVGALVGNSSMENCTASVNVSGNVNVGGLVGSISGSTVSNCHFLSGEITGIGNDNNSIGGIVGNAQTGASTVRDCSANASVKGKQLVGGLCGWLCNGDHSFSNCIMKGSITITSEACGGLVGQLYDSKGKLEKCRFEGSINREGDTRYTGIAIGADDSNVTFPGCECIIDAQTNTSLKGEKVGYIANQSADNEKVRADNYDYSDITVTVKGDDTQN